MSRVKQPIEDARDFAAADADAPAAAQPTSEAAAAPDVAPAPEPVPPPAPNYEAAVASPLAPPDTATKEGRDGHVEHVGSRVLVTIGGEPVEFYQSEQDRINVTLKDRVHDAEAEFVELCKEHSTAVAALHDAQLAHRPGRDERVKELQEGFAWPELAPAKGSDLQQQYGLVVDAAYVDAASAAHARLMPQYKASQEALEALRHPVNLNKTLEGYAGTLTEVATALVDDGAVARDVLLPLHHTAFSQEFNYVKGEMAKVDTRVNPLKDELQRCRQTKEDALLVEDVQAVEEYSFREVDLEEQIMALQRERLEVVVGASDDAATFREKFYALKEEAEEASKRHRALVEERVENLTVDMGTLADEVTAEQARDVAAEAAFEEDLKHRNESLREVTQREREVWDQILQLMRQREELAATREQLTNDKVQAIGQNCKRRAEFKALSEGLLAHMARLEATKETLDTAQRFTDDVAHYAQLMTSMTEKKDVEEEAIQLRIKEQKAYLTMYGKFKTDVDELSHRKETRVLAANRMARHLELEIREAATTLDPNKKRYEADHEELQAEVAKLAEQLSALAQRSQQQQQLWQPTEEQLEEDGVDFDPPDIVAERKRCERKADALNAARGFVSAEQETVDRDTMSLRKLKTSAAVAQDGLARRRDAKAAEGDTSHASA